ncbi:MAG: histidine kinase [Burkholderiaceae bacterium]|nr:histidine kinase [Sulfuritalea sp.]MCF8175683.1 histidine kinase [Burkholderiaceae bacterium]MCF8184653.1 histidine kinase [Polynucleobacter sp.]
MADSSTPSQPLHVLVIAASQEARARLLPVFAEAGKACALHQVGTVAELHAVLREQAWDVVLYIPGIASLSVQAAVQQIDESGLDLPLIVVAGTEDERGTQPAMQAGARDVIDADRLERLIPAVEREVREAGHRADHRAALEMLNESQARFDGLASNLPGMLFQLRRDAEGGYRFLFVSEGCQKLFGFKQQHLLASANRLFDAFDAEKRKSLEFALRESAAKGTLLNWEGHTRGRSRQKWINLRSTPHHLDSGVVEWRGIATNVTDSKESEAALRSSRQQLAELSTHLEAVKEEERERISRDIHDELGSILVFLKIEAAHLASRLPEGADRLREKAHSIESLLDQAMSTASRVARELRPGILKEFGLPAAIECQAEDFTQRFGIPCRVQCDEDAIEPEADTSLALFRIAQEALTNIAKHAHASLVVMRLRRESGNILLEIRDNGRGISEADMQKSKSFGLRGIRERVLSLAGDFFIGPAEHGGTHIVLRVPERAGEEPPREEELQRNLF